MQKPPSYNKAIREKKANEAPPPSYDEVVRPDSPEPQPPIIGPSADRKLIDPFVAPQQEDMPPPIPVSDTDQKITHNRNRQELLLAPDESAIFMEILRGAAGQAFFEPQPPILAQEAKEAKEAKEGTARQRYLRQGANIVGTADEGDAEWGMSARVKQLTALYEKVAEVRASAQQFIRYMADVFPGELGEGNSETNYMSEQLSRYPRRDEP